ncbi:MAG: type II toxin-antitoxin system HicB family antitoxin [Lachnobacterium sp.]|nr:type II toxin-antitoxin system HicB family antitoxin [Lachnobacterium sp.]
MNYIYPAIFYPENNGQYSVIFPDFNNLVTYGDDLPDAFAMATEACGQYLFTSLCDDKKLPHAVFSRLNR